MNKKTFAPRPADWKASSKDWRGTGAITSVKNQGQCGSCWAFSATEAVETAYYFTTGDTVKLSPQQVTSCDTTDDGCNGGDPESAYEYIMEAGGLDPESDYPYTSGGTERTGSCKVKSNDFVAKVTGYTEISGSPSGEDDMTEEIAKSPMSICVDAESWQTYEGGVVDSSTCGTQLDHCVQVVGYEADKNYWIVRNSWGADWGEEGYIRVRAGENACGIAQEATIAKAEKEETANSTLFV